MSGTLLPASSTLLERALADVAAPLPIIEGAIRAISGTKLTAPPPSFLPYLIYEYGLGELTPFVPNLYNLINEGIAWQRVRGTPRSVAMGLAWIGYRAVLEEAWVKRRFWNSFQLRFDTLPASDDPDLTRIEGIASLSVPLRSKMRRGVYAYDVQPLTGDETRLDNSHLDVESGVRATAGTAHFPEGAIWSFGHTTEQDYTLNEADGRRIGNWLDPVSQTVLSWANMPTPWRNAPAPWTGGAAGQRQVNLAAWFAGKVIYLGFIDKNRKTLGFRRCRSVHQVSPVKEGPWTFKGQAYAPSLRGNALYIEARTDFGDVYEASVATTTLVVNAQLAAHVPEGKLWLKPDEIIDGSVFAITPLSNPISLRKTVRDSFKYLMRF